MVKTQETEQICQLIENIIYVDSKHNKVFDYILQHGLSTQIDTIYHAVKYSVKVQSAPLEQQVYPNRPRHIVIDISANGQKLFQVYVGYDQYKSFFVNLEHQKIDLDVLEHCLNALFD